MLRPQGAPTVLFPGAGVQVVGGSGRFLQVVDGLPTPVRGVGYNLPFREITPAQRAERLRRDFALMRRVGVNTVIGWDQEGFDRELLDVAQANGLGVVMHFELKPTWDYADPAVRERLLDEIGAWVDAYRDHPAVRMWGVGNEVMLNFDADQSRAFAEFYVDVYRTVRAHDTLHPVIYREAEEVRVPFFRDAFESAGITPIAFVFGMNFYTPRIDEALADWSEIGFDVPVMISEFAPAGASPMTRPAGWRDLWGRVMKHEPLVLGVAPYAWTTDGPEAVDRIFGLTDAGGRPVDGSLAQIQRLYRGSVPGGDLFPAPPPRVRQPLDMSLDALIAQAMAQAVARDDLQATDIAKVQADARAHYGAELAAAPGYARADRRGMARMLDLLVSTTVLASFKRDDTLLYPGVSQALPLLAGMARWAALDPGAQVVAEDFLTEVVEQALRPPEDA
jgi:hypothetical protein